MGLGILCTHLRLWRADLLFRTVSIKTATTLDFYLGADCDCPDDDERITCHVWIRTARCNIWLVGNSNRRARDGDGGVVDLKRLQPGYRQEIGRG